MLAGSAWASCPKVSDGHGGNIPWFCVDSDNVLRFGGRLEVNELYIGSPTVVGFSGSSFSQFRRKNPDVDITFTVANPVPGGPPGNTMTIGSYDGVVFPSLRLARARGNVDLPLPAVAGDLLGSISFAGFDPVFQPVGAVGMVAKAEADFSGSNKSASISFFTQNVGDPIGIGRMRVMPNGNVSIGDFSILGQTPAVSDKLAVAGNITSTGTITAKAIKVLSMAGNVGRASCTKADGSMGACMSAILPPQFHMYLPMRRNAI